NDFSDVFRYHVKEIFKNYNVHSRNQALVCALFLGDIQYMDVCINPYQSNKPEVLLTSGLALLPHK
ncbi:MAG: hypothetical protein O2963_04020, partial [Proteobacteria bacterium]|nr:hypothetical protein [Pseudomonadota bacterium]